MNIYIGNLAQEVVSDDLKDVFEAYGNVTATKIIMDRESGESKGFGFVEMPVQKQAESAIDGLNGTELKGQQIKVSEARQRKEPVVSLGMRGGKITRGGGRRF